MAKAKNPLRFRLLKGLRLRVEPRIYGTVYFCRASGTFSHLINHLVQKQTCILALSYKIIKKPICVTGFLQRRKLRLQYSPVFSGCSTEKKELGFRLSVSSRVLQRISMYKKTVGIFVNSQLYLTYSKKLLFVPDRDHQRTTDRSPHPGWGPSCNICNAAPTPKVLGRQIVRSKGLGSLP